MMTEEEASQELISILERHRNKSGEEGKPFFDDLILLVQGYLAEGIPAYIVAREIADIMAKELKELVTEQPKLH